MTAANRHPVVLPSREAMVRDGIPPGLLQQLVDEARTERAAAFAAAWRRLAQAIAKVPARLWWSVTGGPRPARTYR